jgi:hypothetical protein
MRRHCDISIRVLESATFSRHEQFVDVALTWTCASAGHCQCSLSLYFYERSNPGDDVFTDRLVAVEGSILGISESTCLTQSDFIELSAQGQFLWTGQSLWL